jgi:DNA-binding SARP family transcriptional activator
MLRVLLLGMVELHVDGEPRPLPAGGDGRKLLTWLALHPGVHPRSDVAEALWPGKPRAAQLNSLKNALTKVRKALGPARFAQACVSERGRLGVPAELVGTDLADVERLTTAGELHAAAELLRGDALPGVSGPWADETRRRHVERESALLHELARRAAAAGDAALELTYARRRAEITSLDAPRRAGA